MQCACIFDGDYSYPAHVKSVCPFLKNFLYKDNEKFWISLVVELANAFLESNCVIMKPKYGDNIFNFFLGLHILIPKSSSLFLLIWCKKFHGVLTIIEQNRNSLVLSTFLKNM